MASARARYSHWVDGALPVFVPFARMGQRSGGSRKGGGRGGGEVDAAVRGEDDDLLVRLRRLRRVPPSVPKHLTSSAATLGR